VDAGRRIRVTRGEVFLEVAPHPPGAGGTPFVVETAHRQVLALGTKFAVRVSRAGTGVLVAQGRVKVCRSGGVVISLKPVVKTFFRKFS
jgi:ferric-dicitrate binding protein FerR (iron transport regulator)